MYRKFIKKAPKSNHLTAESNAGYAEFIEEAYDYWNKCLFDNKLPNAASGKISFGDLPLNNTAGGITYIRWGAKTWEHPDWDHIVEHLQREMELEILIQMKTFIGTAHEVVHKVIIHEMCHAAVAWLEGRIASARPPCKVYKWYVQAFGMIPPIEDSMHGKYWTAWAKHCGVDDLVTLTPIADGLKNPIYEEYIKKYGKNIKGFKRIINKLINSTDEDTLWIPLRLFPFKYRDVNEDFYKGEYNGQLLVCKNPTGSMNDGKYELGKNAIGLFVGFANTEGNSREKFLNPKKLCAKRVAGKYQSSTVESLEQLEAMVEVDPKKISLILNKSKDAAKDPNVAQYLYSLAVNDMEVFTKMHGMINKADKMVYK